MKKPTWEPLDIAGYLFLGGLAGGSSILGAGSQLSGRRRSARGYKLVAVGALSLSLAALVHDLGRPRRFLNMLRVIKPTSPMSVGTWLLASYGPLAGTALVTDLSGRFPRVGAGAAVAAAGLGAAVSSYTAVLISDTAIPAWHEGYRQMPFLFVGSAATAASGAGLVLNPSSESEPARAVALVGGALELGAEHLMERAMGHAAEPLRQGRAGKLMKASRILTLAGVIGAVTLSRRSRAAAVVSGAMLLSGSATTRFGIFLAGVASAEEPAFTVSLQRQRMSGQEAVGE